MDALIVISGRQQGQRFKLDQEVTRLGRGRQNDIPIDDDTSSRLHAEIVRRDDQLYVRDLGSTNGTYLNDKRIDEALMEHGDKLSIGDVSLMYQTSDTELLDSSISFAPTEREPISTHFTISLKDASFVGVRPAEIDDKTQQRFDRLSDFLADVSSVLNPRRLQDIVMDHIFRAMRVDRGLLMLLNDCGELEPVKVRIRDPAAAGQDMNISRMVLEHVMEHGESLLSTDPPGDARFKNTPAIQRDRISSLMCSPLKVQDKILGVLYVDTIGTAPSLGEEDLHLLTAMSIQASFCIENARLYEKLMNAMEHTSSILRSLSSGLLVCDLNGVIGKVNDAAVKLLGLHESDLMGRNLSEFRNLRALQGLIEETLESGRGIDRREIVMSVGTAEIPLGVSTTILEDYTGKIVGVVANFRNLTQIRALTEQVRMSQHLAALGQMAAGVAHEIRNPLNSIRGFAQIMLEQQPSTPHDEYLKIIIEEVDRMDDLVQEMLDFARPRPFTMHAVDVNALVQEVLAECDPAIQAANIALERDLADSLPSLMGDANRLKQVLLNIIHNARQAMEEGGASERRLSVATSLDTRDDEPRLRIRIADTGVGIPKEILGKIFEPFFTKKDVGTGLGLAICRKIVEQHSGRIEVESEVGAGTAFVLVIPVRVGTSGLTAPLEEPVGAVDSTPNEAVRDPALPGSVPSPSSLG